ncbi:hypothetical protein P154DRAFT_358057 [Amniculicola lignicola CBS 123094]|uniref:Uncharacterized protein n=1 Tax=Amniculicola lignicola CBS 123094 TaxID=1392246 RepID=A0A6A5WUG1_9PLEO|nr:hypothetical protein P154DRAFT_358057 [Amniculicola lignicola CBS 123094]
MRIGSSLQRWVYIVCSVSQSCVVESRLLVRWSTACWRLDSRIHRVRSRWAGGWCIAVRWGEEMVARVKSLHSDIICYERIIQVFRYPARRYNTTIIKCPFVSFVVSAYLHMQLFSRIDRVILKLNVLFFIFRLLIARTHLVRHYNVVNSPCV